MLVDLSAFVPVYLAFVLKQFVADFALQTAWMAKGKGRTRDWTRPLLVHAGIHGAATLAITLLFAPSLWWLGPLDFAIHGAIDRAKAAATRSLGPENKLFWWSFGADQAAHQLTHLAYVLAILARMSGGW